MKIAIISDVHLISDKEPFEQIRQARSHFALAWPSFEDMLAKINNESPDINIFLGDIVDWASSENVEFAISLLDKLNSRYVITPGNHDFEMYKRIDNDNIIGPVPAVEGKTEAKRIWQRFGVKLENKVLSDGKTGLILIDSATSEISEDDIDWLRSAIAQNKRNIIFTHTPFDIPEMRKAILAIDANKNLVKYVQSKSPGIFERILKGKTSFIFTGHLHFPIDLTVEGTRMLSLPLSIRAVGREYIEMGQAVILNTNNLEMRLITI